MARRAKKKSNVVAETLRESKVRKDGKLFIFRHGRYIDSGREFFDVARRDGEKDWKRWEFDETTWESKLREMSDIFA